MARSLSQCNNVHTIMQCTLKEIFLQNDCVCLDSVGQIWLVCSLDMYEFAIRCGLLVGFSKSK